MKALRAALLVLLVGWALPVFALVAVPELTGRVVDRTGTLSSDDVAQLTRALAELEERKGSQIAVLIVPSTDGEPIEQFSLRVAEAWKIGRKKVDDGALLVVAKNDRRLRIEVGYGLEGVLTDVTSRRIIDEVIAPKFRTGDFPGGVSAGIERMIGLVNGEKLPSPEPAHWNGSELTSWTDAFPFWLALAFVVSGILRGLLGRLMGSIATGVFAAGLAWFLVGTLSIALGAGALAFVIAMFIDLASSSGRGSGGWSGSSGSSRSSSSSSSGGFSGGGGSFGGGGASGSW